MAPASETPGSTWITDPRFRAGLLVLLSLVIIGYNLGGNSLHNDDEAKHAVVAREAATDGHWLPLTYNDRPYFSKPPLRIWLTALSYRVGGINEWTVRFWSGFFGIATVLALYLIGRRIWNDRTAFLSALILLTSHQYIYNHCVRTGETDSMLIFCWTAGLLLLQLAVQQQSHHLLYASAALIGLCGMVKHLGFVPIVMAIAVGYIVLAGAARAFPLRTWAVSVGVLGAVALPWHLVLWLLKGEKFINAYFLGEVVEKRIQAGPEAVTWRTRGQYISIVTLFRGFFPWSYLLPFSLLDLIGKKGFRRDWLMPTLWLLVAMLATVVSGRKYTWYVLPAFPAAAILVARLLDRFLADSRDWLARISVPLATLAALLSTTSAATLNPFAALARTRMLAVGFLSRLDGLAASWMADLGVLLLLLAGLIAVYSLLGVTQHPVRSRRIASIGTVLAISMLALYTVAVPLKFSRHRSTIHQLAVATDQHLGQAESLYVSLPKRKTRHPRFRFYFGAKNIVLVDPDRLASGELEGQLVLTDWPTVESIGLQAPLDALAQAGGQIVLRFPGT